VPRRGCFGAFMVKLEEFFEGILGHSFAVGPRMEYSRAVGTTSCSKRAITKVWPMPNLYKSVANKPCSSPKSGYRACGSLILKGVSHCPPPCLLIWFILGNAFLNQVVPNNVMKHFSIMPGKLIISLIKKMNHLIIFRLVSSGQAANRIQGCISCEFMRKAVSDLVNITASLNKLSLDSKPNR